MDWSAATGWWLAAGALVAAELATGTFYLLMLSLGCAAAALLSYAGFGISGQLVGAALLGGGATALWYLRRSRSQRPATAAADPDVQLDIGRSVQVDHWNVDGTARVNYRGAAWSVRHAGGGVPAPGTHVIVALHGSELSVAPAARG